ncbi:putative GNAT family N-acyltransferase [Trueperella bonasi]|uniref:GNAT family N-acyltransferase n=1 Tax=Trueperella bonasi TaxID=312286 RepID=A0ABT9NHZ7_9ACTO|nr:GNAT family N-acetyltransferase [Trueperella bonasi]MDP9807026.1 putative GNAT family N-acyltransferase [Trueperella bonasi]
MARVWQIVSRQELERIFAIRVKVFVEEQKVSHQSEVDDLDFSETTLHVLATVDGKDAGTARLMIGGPGQAKVGRVAVHEWARGIGLGRAVMEKIHELAREHAADDDGVVRLELSGQDNAIGFYERLGYEVTTGEWYLDENIWHQDMHLILRRAEGR